MRATKLKRARELRAAGDRCCSAAWALSRCVSALALVSLTTISSLALAAPPDPDSTERAPPADTAIDPDPEGAPDPEDPVVPAAAPVGSGGSYTPAPVDIQAHEPAPAEAAQVPAEAAQVPAPAIALAPEQAPPDESPVHEESVPHLRNPKIPPIGNSQPWFRSSTFFDTFRNNYNTFSNDDRFFALVNYINVGADSTFARWKLSSMIRVDTHNIFNGKSQAMCDVDNDGVISDSESSQCRYGNDYRIERFQLRASTKRLELTVGDFNVNFGRGIGLSIRKIADIGVDATIKGGKVDLRLKKFSATALAGVTNRQQTDFATRTLFDDPGYPHVLCERTPALTRNRYGNPLWTMCSDIVAAGRVEGKLPGKVRVGGHYTFFWFGETLANQHEGMHLVGGDISRKRIAKHWDLFMGVTGLMRNAHLRNTEFSGLSKNGVAAYLSNGITLGDTFVLVEGKYYDNYIIAKDASATTVQYAEAPTLERADQIIPAAGNTAGGRILIEHTLKKSRVTLYGNYLGYVFGTTNDQAMLDPNEGEMTHHAYVGMRWRDPDKGAEVQASAGYRWEGFRRAPAPGKSPYVRKLPHAELYINQVVAETKGMSHSLSLRIDWRYEQVQKGVGSKFFHRGNAILGYGLSPFFTFAVIGGFSSEFAPLSNEPKLHEQACDSEANCNRKPHLWPGAEVRVNFLESSFLRIFAGRQVGGLLCVNGSCRTLPDFEGVRADLILNF